ncbi:xylose isomerase-like protein [Macroventuria anomochaeta]|uniref:Xylose isomerase-like protein n=1 Tax=Macroventuria anomochaeta TaxID=301207 RepID=A0ACB6RXM7_9PLEO|nr:xylose isomerase-like protein [Macroventuria anomochaeta]KAF2625689.1 xylose isomerase-like protein [Macroventuria anomochaeta]
MTFSNKRAISTSSLGLHASHTLDSKIRAAAYHSFTGIEIVYADLEAYGNTHKLDLAAAADQVCQLCLQLGLQVLSLCPFENFEGHNSPLQDRLAKAAHWMDTARTLGAAYIQVPAQFGPDVTGDEAVVVSELQKLADLGSAAEPVISIAYEPMSWSTFYSTWQDAVHLTELVGRKNFKICLDTFHIATKLWASPHDPSGKYPDADRRLAEDLRAFLKEFPMEKLAYIQLSDAERFDPPFSKQHSWYTEGEAAEFTWSKHARPFSLEIENGGYLPVVDIVRAWVIDKGYEGWVSMETFDRRTRGEKVTTEQCAVRAERSWKSLEKALSEPKSLL